MIIYRGKRLKVTKAVGFRLGCAYLPNWKSNPDTDQPISLMVWTGPYIFVWSIKKRGWVPRALDDAERIEMLLKARRSMSDEIAQAYRVRHRRFQQAQRDLANEPWFHNYDQTTELHPDVRRRWQAESDAVKLREMEQNNGNS